jgi:hypothetical protein
MENSSLQPSHLSVPISWKPGCFLPITLSYRHRAQVRTGPPNQKPSLAREGFFFFIDNPGVPHWWPGFCLAFDAFSVRS